VQLNSEATIFIVSTPRNNIQTWGCQFWHGDHDMDFGVEQMSNDRKMNLQSYNDNQNCLIDYDRDVPAVWSGRTNSSARTFWKTTFSSSPLKETATASGSSGGRPKPGLKTFSIGGNNRGCSEKFNGYIGELIYYNQGLSDAEMQQVTDSLVQKWLAPKAQPPSPTPPQGGMTLHLDASTGNAPEDISGNNVALTGASAVGVPTADISGRNAWDFQGHCFTSELVQLNSEATIFIVSTPRNNIQTWGCQFWHGDHDMDFGVEQMSNDRKMNLQSYNDNQNCLIDYDRDVPAVWSGRTNSSARTFWKTTFSSSPLKETATASGSSGGRPKPGLKTFSIGGNNRGCSEKFNGYIGELIYYNQGLSDAEMQQITDSLVQKWLAPQAR